MASEETEVDQKSTAIGGKLFDVNGNILKALADIEAAYYFDISCVLHFIGK